MSIYTIGVIQVPVGIVLVYGDSYPSPYNSVLHNTLFFVDF